MRDGEIAFNVAANPGTSKRHAVLSVTDSKGNSLTAVAITQRGKSDSKTDYLSFTCENESTLAMTGSFSLISSLEYSYDTVNWTDWKDNNYGAITFTPSKPLYLRGKNPDGFFKDWDNHVQFQMTGQGVRCAGDIMKLIDYEETIVTITQTCCFADLFNACQNLVSAPELPATTLAECCYLAMFSGCTGLTTAPELPATTLASDCYAGMFSGCTGLTTAPELSATILADFCYRSMFYGCTSLTIGPELPAKTLVRRCYEHMFGYCSNLSSVVCLANNPDLDNCGGWLQGVTSSGTFTKAKDASWSRNGSGIPTGWTVVDYQE